jgi:DNA repair protein RadC
MIQDTMIREINIHYRKTERELFDIRQPEDAVKFIRTVLPDNSREHCIALYLNGAHQVISYSLVSIGSANMALLTPREIFQRAIAVGAISTVIAHNHPSGSVIPSQEDRRTTARIKEVGELIGIKLLDHIIVSDSDFYSFNDKGDLS